MNGNQESYLFFPPAMLKALPWNPGSAGLDFSADLKRNASLILTHSQTETNLSVPGQGPQLRPGRTAHASWVAIGAAGGPAA